MSSASTDPFQSSFDFPLPEGCFVRRLDPFHLEIWGLDPTEHYLLCYDENQPHLLDVFCIPQGTQLERSYGMG